MNLKHLGDALDFWKGGLMRALGGNLLNTRVLPMFTDDPAVWTGPRLGLYAHLLGVEVSQILNPQVKFSTKSRVSYFQPPANNADLFVDPDTGIEPPSGSDHRHIRFAEIAQLLPKGTGRVLLIYQHASREDNWVDACLQRAIKASALQGCCAFAYRAGSVSMVFIARDRPRLANMYQVLHGITSSLPAELLRALPVIP